MNTIFERARDPARLPGSSAAHMLEVLYDGHTECHVDVARRVFSCRSRQIGIVFFSWRPSADEWVSCKARRNKFPDPTLPAPPPRVIVDTTLTMEISATAIPDRRSGFYKGHFELSEAYDEDTLHVIHFFVPEVHDTVLPAIQDAFTGPEKGKTGFICSSDVVYTNVSANPYIDLTGTVVPSLTFLADLFSNVHPMGSPETKNLSPGDVKLLILFGTGDWNEAMRARARRMRVEQTVMDSLFNNEDALLKNLGQVPVIGGKPTHPELCMSPQGYFVVGSRVAVHTKLMQDSETAGRLFHELKEEVDRSAASFSRPKLIGFVFGAFGSLLRHKRHYMNASAWTKLQSEFPYTQFVGFSTACVFKGETRTDVNFNESRNETLIAIVIVEK